MLRLLMAIAIVLGVTSLARADADLVVLGPAAPDGTPRATLDDVKQAIERAGLGKKPTEIGPSCAVDIACVKATASEQGARRAMAISILDTGKRVSVALVLVDIVANDQLGKRELTIAAKKLDRELAPLLRKFIEEAPTERTKELVATAGQHYSLGEFAQALEIYKRAYQIKPLAELLFNIGQCDRKLGQHKDAITMYQSYLVGVPDAENKALVEDLIAESRAALAAIDQREADRLAADRAEQLRKAREAEALAAQERRRMEQVKSKRRVLPWLAVGIGAAALIGGGLLYATSETDDGSRPTYRDTRPAGIGVAIGGVALAGTGLLWVVRF